MVYGLQFDKFGFPYVAGATTAAFPVSILHSTLKVCGKQFITKIKVRSNGVLYSTNFGKGQSVPDISITAMLVDRCENVYVAGWVAV